MHNVVKAGTSVAWLAYGVNKLSTPQIQKHAKPKTTKVIRWMNFFIVFLSFYGIRISCAHVLPNKY